VGAAAALALYGDAAAAAGDLASATPAGAADPSKMLTTARDLYGTGRLKEAEELWMRYAASCMDGKGCFSLERWDGADLLSCKPIMRWLFIPQSRPTHRLPDDYGMSIANV
jgi:hypothetical protein